MPVAFNYKLTGAGWAEASLTINDCTATVTASYLSDALGDLLCAVINVLSGVSENTFSFVEEPGEYRWYLRRVGAHQLAVEIRWFDDWADFDSSEDKVVFGNTCRLRTFAGAVHDSCKRPLEEFGLQVYREQWVEHDFPLDKPEQLRALLAVPSSK